MKKKNTSIYLFVLFLLITFSSCNVSLNVLNRKYRSGYSIHVSKKISPKLNQSKINDGQSIKSKQDSVIVENNSDDLNVSASNSELFINDCKAPINIIACDTPPKKNEDDPNWSLYNEKKSSSMSKYKGRILEPYGLLAIIFLALGFFISSLLEYLSVWVFLFVFFSVFIMSIISLVKMKKLPDKYMRIFKLTDWIFLAFYILGLFFLLATA
jgi:hypothetical protein